MKKNIAVALVAAVAAAFALGQSAPTDPVLAQWNGGELTLESFVDGFDPDGQAVSAGGPLLEKQVCKAVFQTIYGDRARRAGIDTSPAYLDELAAWRVRRLEAIYVADHSPSPAELAPDAALHEYFEANRERLYTSAGVADLAVLFLRCSAEPDARDACRKKMEEYQERVTLYGEALTAVIDEERASSGPANGSFTKIPLDRLAVELRQAALQTPVGWTSPPIETPAGLFWLRVDGRVDPAPVPFDTVEPHIRQVLTRQAQAEWRAQEAARLRAEFGLPAATSDEAALETAAIAEGLDREGAFLEEARVFVAWKLADLAFFEDREILSDDDAIAARIARPEADSRYRRFDLEWIYVTVGDDRYVALARVDEVKGALAAVTDPSAIDKLIALHDEVGRTRLDSLTIDDVSRFSRELSKDLPDVPDGGWSGPYPCPRGMTVPGELLGRSSDIELPPGIGLAVRRSSRLPSVDEVRDEVFRSFRNEITSVDRFVEVFGARWGLELMIEPDAATGGPVILSDGPDGDPLP